MTKSVAVLGCGPTGLLVAHAAAMCGWNFHIYSRKEKSVIGGAQYLHEQIPGMTGDSVDECAIVDYNLVGTPDEYRQKVYGRDSTVTVSPEELAGETQYAWDIRKCYDNLWQAYSDDIGTAEINAHSIPTLQRHWETYDLVVSTIPRTVFKQEGDTFLSVDAWAVSDLEGEPRVPFGPANNTVICDGTDDVGWYRIANIFQYRTIEWPGNLRKPPIEGITKIRKPIACRTQTDFGFVHLGRYGEWRKGVLTTDAFRQALAIFRTDAIDGNKEVD